MTELSIVIPVYNSSSSLYELTRRITDSVAKITADYEIIYVEDCGKDNSWKILTELALTDHKIKAYQLSRNFGQHIAITAGLSKSIGRRCVVMDCDLQDPPEEIPKLHAKSQEGFDIVLARRKEKQHSFYRRTLAHFYFIIFNFFTKANFDGEYGSFSLITRQVVDAYLNVHDRERHYLFVLAWLGFNKTSVTYEHGKRHSGQSSYTLKSLVRHAVGGVFFQTTVLLNWIVFLGFALCMTGFISAIYIIFLHFSHTNQTLGWSSLFVLNLTLGGFIILSTGVTGLYIGRIFEQVKGRPLFVFAHEVVNGVDK